MAGSVTSTHLQRLERDEDVAQCCQKQDLFLSKQMERVAL